jgi:hypothetical protein
MPSMRRVLCFSYLAETVLVPISLHFWRYGFRLIFKTERYAETIMHFKQVVFAGANAIGVF